MVLLAPAIDFMGSRLQLPTLPRLLLAVRSQSQGATSGDTDAPLQRSDELRGGCPAGLLRPRQLGVGGAARRA